MSNFSCCFADVKRIFLHLEKINVTSKPLRITENHVGTKHIILINLLLIAYYLPEVPDFLDGKGSHTALGITAVLIRPASKIKEYEVSLSSQTYKLEREVS